MATSLGSLRSSTQYPSSSSTIHGFCIYTNFEYKILKPGKTKVTWKFVAGYDSYGSYPATSSYASAGISLTLSATKGSISEITGASYSGSGIKYKDWPTLSSGSCIITHNASGEASFNVSADVSVGGWECDSSKSFTLPVNVPYTACGAPTTVSASGIVAPNGSFTISWSGATNGVSNKIKSYQVFWYTTSSDNITPILLGTAEVGVTDGTTSGSYTVGLNNATRGHKITCGVKALSSLDSAYDSGTKTGGSVIVNSLPGAPSVSVNKTIVPSTNGQVTFTMTAGSDADSGQTRTLYYATSASGSKTKVTSPWSPTVTATTTYYFWTYDGLEYSSSSTAVTITKNTKPTFTVSISSQSLVSSNSDSRYNYIVTPTISISNISGGQSNKKYIYKLLYGTDPNSLTSSKILYNLVTDTQKTISDIRKEGIGHEANGAYYKISVQCYDGIEYSGIKETDTRYVTKVPALKGIYNKSDFTNIDGFYKGDFATHYSKFLGFVFERDNGYNILNFKNYDGTINPIILSTNNNNTRGTWTDEKNLSSAPTWYNFTYNIGYSSGYICSSKNQSITKIGQATLRNFAFNFSGENYKYFSSQAGGEFPNSFGGLAAIKDYGFNEFNEKKLSVEIHANDTQTTLQIEDLVYLDSEGAVSFNFTRDNFNDAISALNFQQKNSAYSATICVNVTNDFGVTSQISQKFYIDFREKPIITQKILYPTGDTKIKDKNISEIVLNKWKYLKEGMEIIGNFEITSYNTNPQGVVLIKRSTEDWKTLKIFNFTKDINTVATATPGNPVKYNASIGIQDIGEISTKNYNVSYKIIIKTDADNDYKTEELIYNNLLVKRHTTPTINVTNTSYSSGEISINYKIIDWGADSKSLVLGNGKNILLYIGNETSATHSYKDNSDFFSTTEKTAQFNYTFGDQDSIQVKLQFYSGLATYLDGDSTAYFYEEKAPELSTLSFSSVFNILPTVAYRKNHLGINVLNPSEKKDAIIVIGETDERNAIYFQPAGANLCQVINFHIDCGDNWGISQS